MAGFLEGLAAREAVKEQASRPAINSTDSLAALLASRPAMMSEIGATRPFEKAITEAPEVRSEGLTEQDVRQNLAAGLAAMQRDPDRDFIMANAAPAIRERALNEYDHMKAKYGELSQDDLSFLLRAPQ